MRLLWDNRFAVDICNALVTNVVQNATDIKMTKKSKLCIINLQKQSTMENLLEQVKADVEAFLNQEQFFCNECHLQMELAAYLRQSGNYSKVHLEYFVPGIEVQKQIDESLVPSKTTDKPQNLYIDIVVEKDGEFLPIELKYKTAPLKKDIDRFGEVLQGVDVLKNHGARDLGAYDFWRDVNRIECLMKRFRNVKNGIALFLTNDQGYWTLPKDGTNPNYANFSMKDGKHSQKKNWQGNTAMSAARPSFILDNGHKLKWLPEIEDKQKWYSKDFRYCLLEIK